MKILVFDDKAENREIAMELLVGHEVTCVGTYEEAENALTVRVDDRKLMKIFRENREISMEEAKEMCTTRPEKYDVVLTDLLVPAGKKQLGEKGRQFIGQEMPLGTIIAFQALKAGVKLVAVVTDTNHHDHPASAALDGINDFVVGDAKILMVNTIGKNWKQALCLLTGEKYERKLKEDVR